jgi:hypothetical protein
VAVELPGAAPAAAVAEEPHVPYDIDELLLREPEEISEFLLKSVDLFVKRKRCDGLHTGIRQNHAGTSIPSSLDGEEDMLFGARHTDLGNVL